MYSNCKDEMIIKLVGRISLEFPELDHQTQLKIRAAAEEVLYKFDIVSQETSLVASDIEDKLQMYLAVKKLDGLSKKTLKNYYYELMKFGTYIRKPLSSININDLRMYLANRCKDMKESSINSIKSYLKTFFSWLQSEEYIPKDPTTKLKQTKVPKRVREPLSDEEIEIVRQTCINAREAALVEFAYSTGCRLSEIVGVDVADINWNQRTLKVIGKGNKEREVCFSTKAKILLDKYLKTRKGDSEALFLSERAPYARIGGRAIEKEIDKIGKRAEINKPIYPHIFRHSFATHLLDKGVALHIVQELMGHETSATTQIYARTSRENVIHAYRLIS
jgi:integrase/recombinase XerD